MELSQERINASRLDDAINRADLTEVREILDEGVDPNIKDVVGDPVIIGAAHIGANDVVKMLVSKVLM